MTLKGMVMVTQKLALEWLQQKPIFLDTETTGLDEQAQVVDLAIIDHDGTVLMDTLIRPTVSIPDEASAVHGISNIDVLAAPTFADVLPQIKAIVTDRILCIYNASYDIRILRQSARAHLVEKKFEIGMWCAWNCVMELYAEYFGDWSEYYQSYRWQKLGDAASQCEIVTPKLHRAMADAEITRLILIHMANNGRH